MKKSFLRIPLVLVIAIFVLGISGTLMMIVSKNTGIFDQFPGFQKTFSHSSMLVFSVLFILILNKGKLKGFGFKWSLDFPVGKVIVFSLMIGFLSFLVSKLMVDSSGKVQAMDFTITEKIIYIWIWASVCEEVLTRGLVQGFLAPLKKHGISVFKSHLSIPVIVGALIFGAMHLMLLNMGFDLSKVLIIVIFAIVLGLYAGYQCEKTNSLVPAILVHICVNIGGSVLGITGLW